MNSTQDQNNEEEQFGKWEKQIEKYGLGLYTIAIVIMIIFWYLAEYYKELHICEKKDINYSDPELVSTLCEDHAHTHNKAIFENCWRIGLSLFIFILTITCSHFSKKKANIYLPKK
mgnify:CR=1 FL=1